MHVENRVEVDLCPMSIVQCLVHTVYSTQCALYTVYPATAAASNLYLGVVRRCPCRARYCSNWTELDCSVLQYTALHCTALSYTTLNYTALQCTLIKNIGLI